MNWSTRLRRWVRISTPPVREASMKPTAATVLPAPVACSNQKRRSAPGVLGRLGDDLGVLVLGLLPVLGLLVGREQLVLLVELGDSGHRCRSSAPSAVPVAVGLRAVAAVGARRASSGPLDLGDDRRQRAGERVDLVVVELGAVEQLRGLLGEQALEPEQQRVVAAPLDRRRLGARRRARRGRRRPRGGGRCPAPVRRSSRRRAGSARGRTPAPDRGRSRSIRRPRSRLRQWY